MGDLASDRVRRCSNRGVGARHRTARASVGARPAARHLDRAACLRRDRDPPHHRALASAARAGTGARRHPIRSRATADAQCDARHHRPIRRRPARVPDAGGARRPARTLRSRRPGPAVGGRTRVPDLHRPRRTERAPEPAAARDRLQGRAHAARTGGPRARAAVHSRHCHSGAGFRRRQHPDDIGVQLGAAGAARLTRSLCRHAERRLAAAQRLHTAARGAALSHRRDSGRRVGGAAAARDPRPPSHDGGDVGADAICRGGNQQRAADDHRPLRPARAQQPGRSDAGRDLRTITAQAQRIAGLLDKMRSAAHQRLKEMQERISVDTTVAAAAQESVWQRTDI